MTVIAVNSEDWEKVVLNSDSMIIVDFWHHHCSWCIRLNPILEEVSNEYENKVAFTKINVLETPENQQIAIKYGVMATPTLIFFCDKRPVESTLGFQSKESLKNKIEELLMKHRECLEKSTELK
ncbi:MAG: thiol reductase thioredoxin [Candidatus Bathyarchaeota archaeon]|nr:MAG: thiol reductase thioredoxin [Candidatus Bathyarchaeota archaeon]